MKILDLLFDNFDFEGRFIYLVALEPEKESYENDIRDCPNRHVKHRKQAEMFINTYKETHNIHFGVCARNDSDRVKSSVACVNTIWLDIDNTKEVPNFILPPTAIISSGNGLHCYWKLDHCVTEFDEVEAAIKQLELFVGADSTSDITRIMRVDGTTNFKPRNKKKKDFTIVAKPVELLKVNEGAKYSLTDIINGCRIRSDKTISMISDGSKLGYESRSERDFAIITDLVRAMLTNKAIYAIFEYSKCGDKWKERGGDYLDRTIAKVRKQLSITEESIVSATDAVGGIFEAQNSYWKIRFLKGGEVSKTEQLSNFSFVPKYIVMENDEQKLLVDVVTEAEIKENVILPRTAFHSAKQLKQSLKQFDWVWYGNDKDVVSLNYYILQSVDSLDVKQSVSTIGYKDGIWLGDKQTLLGRDWVDTSSVDLIYDNRQNHIQVKYNEEVYSNELDYIRTTVNHLVNVNAPGKIFPILGWFCAAIFKSRMQNPFPILNLYGTRGSGKTQTIMLLQKLGCYTSTKTFDCMTTNFTLLTLLSSTTDVPVSLSEYREDDQIIMRNLNRLLLLLYDRGVVPRGKQDQSVNNYVLSSPLTLDGEDPASDPAILERCLQILLSKNDLDDSRIAHFNALQLMDLSLLGTRLIEYSINKEFSKYLQQSQGMCQLKMSARVRNNIEVSLAGLLYFQEFLYGYGIDLEIDCDWFESIVINQETQFTVLDTFTSDLVNIVAQQNGKPTFTYKIDKNNILWVHFASAYNFWREKFSRYHVGAHSEKSIRIQMKERSLKLGEEDDDSQNYIIAPTSRSIKGHQYHCWGVDIKKAKESGLDIPSELKVNSSITLKTKKGE